MKAVYIFETFLLHFELTYWNWTGNFHWTRILDTGIVTGIYR